MMKLRLNRKREPCRPVVPGCACKVNNKSL